MKAGIEDLCGTLRRKTARDIRGNELVLSASFGGKKKVGGGPKRSEPLFQRREGKSRQNVVKHRGRVQRARGLFPLV